MNKQRLTLMIALLILPLILAALASYSIWGYFIAPPAPLTDGMASVSNMSLVSLREELTDKVRIRTTMDNANDYYFSAFDVDTMHHLYANSANDYQICRGVDALYEQIPASVEQVDPQEQAAFSDFLTEQQDAYAAQTGESFLGCNGTDFRGHAVLMEGYDANGQPLLYATVSSNQLHNDDYRLLEYVFAQTNDGLELLKSQQFIYHVAGMEGFDFRILWPLFTLAMLPFILAAWWLTRRPQNKRKRDESHLVVG